ncbi:SAM-dependent methyltransferase [Actinokineospora iranica]|uniref:S-adenosyl-L-methionine-dependent methyltransferase n=1 Tax=Actinokineospora iranica TaxID=1271860 RepID=A0A1G6YBY4_9PSEU|nr:SAM-dependent methyltransferase [Actinokineospora iranica]SDD87984.1 methyltransferase, TIGR00027 family [Actinokineospora iranica]
MSETLSGIGWTALGVAALRARENERPDRLFEDPYARHVLTATGVDPGTWGAGAASFIDLMADQVAVRTRFLDQALLDAVADGRGQVVLLASGMDTRPFRLHWPEHTRLYELDFAEVLAHKRTALTGAVAGCAHVEVPTDLRENWPDDLRAAGFDPTAPTVWLAEGILYALPAPAADLLLTRVSGLSAPGSALAADHGEDSEPLRAARAAISSELVGLWQGGPADPGAWLADHGWEPAVLDVAEVAESYGRPAPPAFDPARADSGRGWLITAHWRG